MRQLENGTEQAFGWIGDLSENIHGEGYRTPKPAERKRRLEATLLDGAIAMILGVVGVGQVVSHSAKSFLPLFQDVMLYLGGLGSVAIFAAGAFGMLHVYRAGDTDWKFVCQFGFMVATLLASAFALVWFGIYYLATF